jgi:D-inositol-3-phosphate glycosyltransferase
MLSIEAQHAGCRVVASKAGGLPETNCGGLLTVRPDNALSLAQGIAKAAQLGPLTETERARASQYFTVEQSVDSLLRVMKLDGQLPRTTLLREPLMRFHRLPRQWPLLDRRLKR